MSPEPRCRRCEIPIGMDAHTCYELREFGRSPAFSSDAYARGDAEYGACNCDCHADEDDEAGEWVTA